MSSTTSIAGAHGAKTVSAGHLRASIMGNEKFDFLKDIVEGVPDLPPAEAGAGIEADAAAGGKKGIRLNAASARSRGVGVSRGARKLEGEQRTTNRPKHYYLLSLRYTGASDLDGTHHKDRI